MFWCWYVGFWFYGSCVLEFVDVCEGMFVDVFVDGFEGVG